MKVLLVLLVAIAFIEFGECTPRKKRQDKGTKPAGSCDIVAFGDSYTDDGVDFDDPHGFKIYSNGPVWPTYLARLLGCNEKDVRNFGYGGATSGYGNIAFEWSGLLWQVDQYTKYYTRFPSKTIAAFLPCGDNDFYRVGDLTKIDEKTRADFEKTVVDNNMLALQKLANAGVKQFMLTDLIVDLSRHTPDAPTELKNEMVDRMNKKLTERILKFKADNPELEIGFAQTKGLWEEFKKHYANLAEPFDVYNAENEWGDNLGFTWWNDGHPNTGVHRAFAEKLYEAFKAEGGEVPDAGTPVAVDVGDQCKSGELKKIIDGELASGEKDLLKVAKAIQDKAAAQLTGKFVALCSENDIAFGELYFADKQMCKSSNDGMYCLAWKNQ
jgi:hypothetical protein